MHCGGARIDGGGGACTASDASTMDFPHNPARGGGGGDNDNSGGAANAVLQARAVVARGPQDSIDG